MLIEQGVASSVAFDGILYQILLICTVKGTAICAGHAYLSGVVFFSISRRFNFIA